MINWNGSSGGAVVFITLFLAVMAEAWILGADDVTTVTEFEISEMGAAMLPAAIEDAKAVAEAMREEAKFWRGLHEEARGGTPEEAAVGRRADEADILVWQATRIIGLLEHLNRINRPDVAEGVV